MSTTKANGVVPNGLETHLPSTTLQKFLTANPSIRYVRFQMLDYGSTLRTRLTPIARALQIASNPDAGILTAGPLNSGCLPNGAILWETIRTHGDRWLPDWSSLKACTYHEGHASVMCWIKELSGEEDEAFSRDPRTLLQRVVRDAEARAGVTLQVGIELEFTLLASADAEALVDMADSAWVAAALRNPYYAVLEESVAALEAAGIAVWGFHPEGAPGKFEIATAPLPPVEAVDAYVFAQEAVKTIAWRHGYYATMHPRAFQDGPTNGAHVHMSISRPDKEDNFLAGILSNFGALTAMLMPSVDSFQRSEMFGQPWVYWGNGWKMAPIVKKGPGYWEFRTPDAMANMYIALAGLVGIGVKGLEEGEELTIKGKESTTLAVDEEERKKLGITKKMPADLGEALEELKKCKGLEEVFGKRFLDQYLLYKEHENKTLGGMKAKERRLALLTKAGV